MRIGIIYHCVAHYREPLFRLLCSQTNHEFRIYAGTTDIAPSLKTVDPLKTDLRWTVLRNHWFFGRLLWQSGVFRLSLSRDADVLVFLGNAYFLSSWVGALLARLSGKRVVMWGHGFISDEKGLKGAVRATFYRLAHAHLVYHHRAREILIRKGFAPGKVTVIYNSLDYPEQKRLRESLTPEILLEKKRAIFADAERPVLLWIGRLTRQKRLDQLLEAAEVLRRQGTDVSVLFVGNGPEKGALEARATELGISDRVRHYGACHRESELAPLIMLSELCVAPGEVGLTCMHALAYGTPVVTHSDPDHQMPEYEAIVAGESGSFFRKDSIEDLARTIRDWLKVGRPREEIRRNCIEIIERSYNPAKQAEIINSAIEGEIVHDRELAAR